MRGFGRLLYAEESYALEAGAIVWNGQHGWKRYRDDVTALPILVILLFGW